MDDRHDEHPAARTHEALVEEQAADGRYSNSSGYVRDPIRRDQVRREKIAARQALVDEARAGPIRERTMDEILEEARRAILMETS